MNLEERILDKKSLEELILNINNRTGIRNEILEKDYYVKGKCIRRF